MLTDEFGNASLCPGHKNFRDKLLESDDKFGFIIVDNDGTLFGTLSGNTREVLHKFPLDLPKRLRRGGPSSNAHLLRYARLRREEVHKHVRKTAELATQFYINPATSQPNVLGLVLAGSSDFKPELSQSDVLDPRLQAQVLDLVGVVDVSYPMDDGFNQAIAWSEGTLAYAKVALEKKFMLKYYYEIEHDTGKYVFGVDDTLKALERGAVEVLIVWESLETNRYVLKNAVTGELVIKHLSKEQEVDQSNFREAETRAELEVQEKLSLVEWFANEYNRFGCTLDFVTNKSVEGSHFVLDRAFGGIGGILRYELDLHADDEVSDGEYGDYCMMRMTR